MAEIRAVRENLPRAYYRELPRLAQRLRRMDVSRGPREHSWIATLRLGLRDRPVHPVGVESLHDLLADRRHPLRDFRLQSAATLQGHRRGCAGWRSGRPPCDP